MEPRSRANTANSVADGNENPGSDSENHKDTDNKLDVSTILDISSESDGCNSDEESRDKYLKDYEGEDQFVNSKSWKMRNKNPEKYVNMDDEDYYGDYDDVLDEAKEGDNAKDDVEEGAISEEEANENKPKRSYKRKNKKPVLMWHVWEEENNKWLDENMKKGFDLDNKQHEVMIESQEAPSNMVVELLRYQKEWLAWALKQESSVSRGGILADEMGMGKTVQAIALVLAKRELSKEVDEPFRALSLPGPSTALTGIKCTLVICPTVAVKQWESEIDKSTSEGSAKVLVYYGSDREKDFTKFSEYSFVITTYGTVESEFRRLALPPKDTTKHSSRASLLHAVKWERIILDEAHHIKARHSKTAKAIFALESSYKWALSGTPFENNVEEIYSLIRFLQIPPYSFYLCKDCDCRVLEYSRGQCLNCPHKCHFSWWKKFIGTPIRIFGPKEKGMRSIVLLKHKILKSILLRRTKKGRAVDLALPLKIVSLRRDTLDGNEQNYYESLYDESVAVYNTYVQAGTVMKNSAHIFELLLRLRQALNHPYLVEYRATTECGVCGARSKDHVVMPCKHVFCKSCLYANFPSSSEPVSCPSCSELLPVNFLSESPTSKTTIEGFSSSSILNKIQLDNFETSTKIEALREEIRFMAERDSSAKGIVFSYFKSFLDLIQYSLQKSGIKCVRLVGGMTMNARDSAIERFTEDPDCRILLMSLKAGGVALNLMVASHVFLMEPWWNPAAELQAQDRVHRIGQYKPIRIVRFIIENSIEERILKLQESKELMFKGAMDDSSDGAGQFAEGLKFIFRHRFA